MNDFQSLLVEPKPEFVALNAVQVALLARYHEEKAKEAGPPEAAAANRDEAERLTKVLVAMFVAAAEPQLRQSPPPSVDLSAQEFAYVSDGYLKSAIAEQAGGHHVRGFTLARRGLVLRAEAQRRDPQVNLEPLEDTPLAVAGNA